MFERYSVPEFSLDFILPWLFYFLFFCHLVHLNILHLILVLNLKLKKKGFKGGDSQRLTFQVSSTYHLSLV